MKSKMKFEIAMAAGMSDATLRRWLHSHRMNLQMLGIRPTQKLLPPRAVEYICHELGLTEEDFG